MRHIATVPGLSEEDWTDIKRFMDLLGDHEFVQSLRAPDSANQYDMTDAPPDISPIDWLEDDMEVLRYQPWRQHHGQRVIDNASAFVRLVRLAQALPQAKRPAGLPSADLIHRLLGDLRVPAQRAAA